MNCVEQLSKVISLLRTNWVSCMKKLKTIRRLHTGIINLQKKDMRWLNIILVLPTKMVGVLMKIFKKQMNGIENQLFRDMQKQHSILACYILKGKVFLKIIERLTSGLYKQQ